MKVIIISGLIGAIIFGGLTYKAWHGKPWSDDMFNSILAGGLIGSTIGFLIYWYESI